jgi:hypothetical protein
VGRTGRFRCFGGCLHLDLENKKRPDVENTFGARRK